MNWLRFTSRASGRVEVVSAKETRRLDARLKKQTEKLLRSGVKPRHGEWCTHEMVALSKRLSPPAEPNVTPIRKQVKS